MTKLHSRAGVTAQWAKGLASEPDSLGVSPGVRMVEGENRILQVPSDPHTRAHPHNTHTLKDEI